MHALIKGTISATRILPWLAVAALSWPVAASADGAKSLEGTWDITVTLRNCQSGAAIRSFPRMVTFAKGGTLSEFSAAGLEAAPVARAPGHGAWEYLGDSWFAYSLKFLRLTAAGGPDGFISEVRELEVNGDSFAADGSAVITLANGVTFPACATEVGTRLY